jgi:hypothetical protein
VENTYTLVIPAAAQSLNTVGVNSKNNRSYRGARRKWCGLIKKHAGEIPEAEKPRRVFFTRFWGKGKRAYDYGNLVGGFKPLLDELVKAGYLIDDCPKYCSEYYRQFKSPDGTEYVVITFEDYEVT